MYGNYLGAYGEPMPKLRVERRPIMRHLLTVDGVEPSERAVSRLLGELPKGAILEPTEMRNSRYERFLWMNESSSPSSRRSAEQTRAGNGSDDEVQLATASATSAAVAKLVLTARRMRYGTEITAAA